MKITKEYCDYCGNEMNSEGHGGKNGFRISIDEAEGGWGTTVHTIPLEEKELCDTCFGNIVSAVAAFKTAFDIIKTPQTNP